MDCFIHCFKFLVHVFTCFVSVCIRVGYFSLSTIWVSGMERMPLDLAASSLPAKSSCYPIVWLWDSRSLYADLVHWNLPWKTGWPWTCEWWFSLSLPPKWKTLKCEPLCLGWLLLFKYKALYLHCNPNCIVADL